MRSAVIGAVAALGLMSTPTEARDDALQTAFGNTIISRYPDGGWVKHWFEPDGRYTAKFADGRALQARWRVEGEKICLNGIRPAIMLINRFCSPMVEARVGQTWQSRDPLGRRVTNTLVAGRQ